MLLFCYKTGYISDDEGKKVVSLHPLNDTSKKTYLGKSEYEAVQHQDRVSSTDLSARLASVLLPPK